MKLLPLLFLGLVNMGSLNMTQLPDFDTLWNYSNPSETRVKFEELLPKAKESGDHSYYLQLLTQIARTYSLESNFVKAHEILDEVEKEKTQDLTLVEVRYLLERGRTFNSNNKKETAFPLFVSAFDLGKSNSFDYFAVDAAHMASIAAANLELKKQWAHTGIEYAEGSEDVKVQKWLGALYNNLGWDYHENKEYTKALELFEKALFYHNKYGNSQSQFIAKWTVARCKRSLGLFDEALTIQLELKTEMERSDNLDGYVYEELAEIYYAKNELNISKPYFLKAYELLSKDSWFVANETERLNRLKELSK